MFTLALARIHGYTVEKKPLENVVKHTAADLQSDLLLYQHIATMDGDAPLPPLVPTPPDWARAAAHAEALGLGGLATKLAARA